MQMSTRVSVASLFPMILLASGGFGQQSNTSSTKTQTVFNPNATAVVPIPGYRLDQPYPGKRIEASEPGWSVHLSIRESSETWFGNVNGFVQFDLELHPPVEPSPWALYNATGNLTIDREVTDTWMIAMIFLGFQDEVHSEENQPDGSCQDILNEQCMSDVTNSTLDTKWVLDGETDQREVHFRPIEDASLSCPWSWWRTVRSFPLYDRFDVFQRGSIITQRFSKKTAEYENAYDFYGRRTLPIAILFSHSNTTAKGEAPDQDHLVLACIKATEALNGSRLPSTAVRGLGVSSSAWGLALACLVSSAILF